ncbi:hypothetical protein M422DRAFT_150950 [Sphaerobolus stellatus SS14]|nr:hypothetical protein M422DRAFT_150950 [Sphaerobolus stellatus SS14]
MGPDGDRSLKAKRVQTLDGEVPGGHGEGSGGLGIYAPNIRLVYRPPASALGLLATTLPETFQVEGLPMYHASAAFVRHTLSALNTKLRVVLCKLRLRGERRTRKMEIEIRTIVTGETRLSGTQVEWDVVSTYSVNSATGLIDVHTVESIQPAPHISIFDGLRASLGRLTGVDLGRPSGAPSTGR